MTLLSTTLKKPLMAPSKIRGRTVERERPLPPPPLQEEDDDGLFTFVIRGSTSSRYMHIA